MVVSAAAAAAASYFVFSFCFPPDNRLLADTSRSGDKACVPPTPSSLPSSIACRRVGTKNVELSRAQAAALLDEHVLPARERGRRIALGSQHPLWNKKSSSHALDAGDPILFETYGEFPLSSLDILLDRAEEILNAAPPQHAAKLRNNNNDDDTPIGAPQQQQQQQQRRRTRVVDVGSGCGRLALYLALSRPDWDVVGVELSPALHREAVAAVHRAAELGYVQRIVTADGDGLDASWDDAREIKIPTTKTASSSSRLDLHCGSAQSYSLLLQEADLIFCYSTAFESAGFSEESCAMLLSDDWSRLFAVGNNTNHNTLCITTDKALNPYHGWRILDCLDVPNPEVFESTGYIQQRST